MTLNPEELLPKPPRLLSPTQGYDWREFDRWIQRLYSLLGDIPASPTAAHPSKAFNIMKALGYVPPGTTPVPTRTTALETRVTALELGVYKHTGNVLDEGTFTLPVITKGGFGSIVIGTIDTKAFFSIDSTGTVDVWMYWGDEPLGNENTDGYFCIGTSVTNPVICKNRLGSTKAILLNLWYN